MKYWTLVKLLRSRNKRRSAGSIDTCNNIITQFTSWRKCKHDRQLSCEIINADHNRTQQFKKDVKQILHELRVCHAWLFRLTRAPLVKANNRQIIIHYKKEKSIKSELRLHFNKKRKKRSSPTAKFLLYEFALSLGFVIFGYNPAAIPYLTIDIAKPASKPISTQTIKGVFVGFWVNSSRLFQLQFLLFSIVAQNFIVGFWAQRILFSF